MRIHTTQSGYFGDEVTRIADMHVHTDDSPDANIPATELLARASRAGLAAVGFVAHLDLDPEDFCYGGFDGDGYLRSLSTAARDIPETRLIRGLEIGEPHRFGDAARRLADYSQYDFITGALHTTKRAGMILGPDAFQGRDPIGIIGEYLTETVEMVTSADMDILAHFGLFRRGMALAGLDTSLDETELFPGKVDAILEVMTDRGIALEVNTSGLRRLEKVTYPIPSIIRRYRELGGELVTLGSDTHREPWIFFGLEEGRRLLLESGFRRAFIFSRRTPEAYPLD